ncbi:MAG: hypothetical protein JRF64_05340 [Deltaproteobacteria bacterium]|nr:hypothetical protein [Deltaproteobacteria bacterium]MBW2174059.1 hypothetical protein [Deltaproteobacteria bacterium]
MERFRKYMGSTINLENIKNAEAIKVFGVACRHLPDPPEDFDEFEFVSDFGGTNNLGLMVTVESMMIKRIYFGLISAEDPDIITGLTDEQLTRLLDQQGDAFIRFFDFITQ